MSKETLRYMTREECSSISTFIKEELSVMKKALVGPDLQGGLVRQVNELQSQVARIVSNGVAHEAEKKSKQELLSREKIALIGVIGALVGILVEHALVIIEHYI